MRRAWLLLWVALGGAALGAGAAGCSSGVTPSAPRAFNRPDRVAFVCFDVTSSTDPRPTPLAECRTLTDGSYPTNRRLHALVTQVVRGEVAAVDLTGRTILDSDRRIPGFTFVPVDEVPVDIVAPAEHAGCAWVASAGGRSLTAIANERFRPEHGDDVANSESSVALPGRPARLALAPDERTIWISFPELGAVGRVAIDPDRCTTGAVDLVILAPDVPPGVMPDPQRDEPRICAPDGFLLSEPATFAPREYVPDDPVPQPSDLVVDVERGELYVGDRNLPLVHRVELSTGTLLSSLSVGAPIRDLAITPALPDTYGTGATTESRYLYAIDDVDGTVMVVDVTDAAAPGFGAVLGVDVDGSFRPDRIPFPVAARAVEIVLHGFDRNALDPRVGSLDTTDRYDGLCDFTTTPTVAPSPSNLRGAFAMVAMADGSVRVVDLYDLGAPCRGRAFGEGTDPASEDCLNPSVANDTFVYIRRHRPRAGSFLQRPVSLTSVPTFFVNGAQLSTDESGRGGGIEGPTPRLEEIACPTGLAGVFPATLEDPARGRVCTITDPFSAFAESWLVAWQGAFAGTTSTTGNFDDVGGAVVLDARVDFCERGVLGAEAAAAIPASEPEHQPLGDVAFGDMLAITTRISDDLLRTDERCRHVVGITAFGQTVDPILVPIRRALSRPDGLLDPYVGQLVLDADAPLLDPDTGLLPVAMAPQSGRTLADARACLGDQLVTFEVRARASYVVTGARTGHLSRVVRDATTGECVLDPTLPRTDVGRAFHDVPYRNPRIAFLLTLPGDVRTFAGTELRITITGTPAPMGLDLGALAGGGRALALPSEVVWSETVSHAFVIDPERRGLVELELAPLRVLSNTRYE